LIGRSCFSGKENFFGEPQLIVNYFGCGAIIDGGMYGRMNQNDWMGGHSWKWFPTIVTLLIGVLIGWLLFRKKINQVKIYRNNFNGEQT